MPRAAREPAAEAPGRLSGQAVRHVPRPFRAALARVRAAGARPAHGRSAALRLVPRPAQQRAAEAAHPREVARAVRPVPPRPEPGGAWPRRALRATPRGALAEADGYARREPFQAFGSSQSVAPASVEAPGPAPCTPAPNLVGSSREPGAPAATPSQVWSWSPCRSKR